ncbi:unnamed protein product [Absidia cylindrospora]
MWQSHITANVYGHYDVWHRTYPDTDTDTDQHHHHHHPEAPLPIQAIPPLSKKASIRDTPCVSLLHKGRASYNPLFLCDRPYSPFSGFYDQDDIYNGQEYDVFGGEPSHGLDQVAFSSSLTSTTTTIDDDDDDDIEHHPSIDIFSDDPFSIPNLEDGACDKIINRPTTSSRVHHQSSSPVMATKRMMKTNDLDRMNHATTPFDDKDHITALKRRRTGNEGYQVVNSPSSTDNPHHYHHHHDLADYPLYIFSPDLTSSPIPVDGMLEYN